ncbi:MAG: hypothetical protein HY328_10135 [Chloroflexi bacterium]|nr:hypothetical protein [Chloroflexota bacterium]
MGVRNDATQNRRRPSGGCGAAVALLVAALLVGLAVTVVLTGPQLLARSLPPSTSLPVDFTDRTQAQARAECQARERERLQSYGWVDKDAAIAHIPVAEAIQRMAAAGLPVGAPTETAPVASAEAGAEAAVPAEVSFQSHVLPILVERCSECHGDDDPEEGLEVTTYRTLLLGSIYGAVIKAGDAEGSYLMEMISSGKMPKKGDPLTPRQIEIIRAWIDAGALDN